MEKSDVMVFEQPEELNKLAWRQVPWAAARRRDAIECVAFLLALALVCLLPGWLIDYPPVPARAGDRWVTLISLTVIILCLVWGVNADRREKLSRRTLQINDSGILLKAFLKRTLRWADIHGFRLEPLEGRPEAERLTVRYKAGLRLKTWPMILADSAQADVFLSEVKKRKEHGLGNFTIEILDAPAPPLGEEAIATFRATLHPLYCLFFGVFLALAANPLFCSVECHRGSISPRLAVIGPILGTDDLDNCALAVAGTMTVLGTGMMVAAILWGRRIRRAESAASFV
jgi:hypothetical protein